MTSGSVGDVTRSRKLLPQSVTLMIYSSPERVNPPMESGSVGDVTRSRKLLPQSVGDVT
jgi:hypothetical protein